MSAMPNLATVGVAAVIGVSTVAVVVATDDQQQQPSAPLFCSVDRTPDDIYLVVRDARTGATRELCMNAGTRLTVTLSPAGFADLAGLVGLSGDYTLRVGRENPLTSAGRDVTP